MRIIDCEQYSDEWWAARRGIPTASEFGSILTPKTMTLSKAATGYIHQLIAEALDPDYPRIDKAVSQAMQRGTDQEPESRRWYELQLDCEVRQVGFCISDCGRFGCSPDGLVGEDGGLELKNPLPHTQVEYLEAGVLPAEYQAQVHGQLLVTGRAWFDFLSYCPGLPPLLVRTRPDQCGYTGKLAFALELFWSRLQEIKAKIEGMT